MVVYRTVDGNELFVCYIPLVKRTTVAVKLKNAPAVRQLLRTVCGAYGATLSEQPGKFLWWSWVTFTVIGEDLSPVKTAMKRWAKEKG